MQMQYALILGAVSIHYCSFLHSGHATSFLRLYRISSHLHTPTSSSICFYGTCYTANFSHDHHPAPAFTAPAIKHIIQSPSASFTAPAVSSPRQKVISLIFKLYPMTKSYWWQLLPSLPNWHPHQFNARCAIYAIFASLAPPPIFFNHNPVNDGQPKGTLVIPG